jgi:hypothetical protein
MELSDIENSDEDEDEDEEGKADDERFSDIEDSDEDKDEDEDSNGDDDELEGMSHSTVLYCMPTECTTTTLYSSHTALHLHCTPLML